MATDLTLNRGVAVLQAARSETSLFSSFISASPGMLNKPAAFRAVALANTPRVRIIARASPGLSSDNESDSVSGGCGAGSSSTGSSSGRASSPQRSSSFSGGSGGKSGGGSGNAGAQGAKVLPPAAHGNVTGATVALEKGAQEAEDVDEATRRAVLRDGEMQRRQQQQRRRAAEEEDVSVEAGGDVEKYIATYNRWVRLGGRLDKCVGLLEQMHQHALFDPNQIYHNLFFSMCKSERAVASAFRFVALLESAGAAQLSTYNQLLSVCSHCADVTSAQKVLRMVQASRWRADTALYTALIAACCKSAKLDLAFKVRHLLRNPPSSSHPPLLPPFFPPYGAARHHDQILFSALINVAAHANKPDAALALLQEMRRARVQPGTVTYAALMGMYNRVRHAPPLALHSPLRLPLCPPVLCLPPLFPASLSVSPLLPPPLLPHLPSLFPPFLTSPLPTSFPSTLRSMVEQAFSLYHEAQVDGARIGHAICESMIEICMEQHRTGASKPSFSFVIGHLPMAFDLRHPDNDWAECGLAVYRQSVACGVIPTLNLLSKLLCLLRAPHSSSSSSSSSSPSSPHTPLAVYTAGEEAAGRSSSAAPAAPPAFASRLPPSLPSSGFALSSSSSSSGSHNSGSYSFTVPETVPSNLESAPAATAAAAAAAAAAAGSGRSSGGSGGAGSASSPLADVFDLYEPLAYSLYEEAEVLGAVPVLSSTAGPISLRFAGYPPNLAEVCVLVLLRGLLKKYRAMPGMKIFPIALHLPVESVEVSPLKRKGTHTLQIASRTSQGVAALLRRLGLPYFGYESSGVLRITASAVTRWLRLRPHAPTTVPLATITGDGSSLAAAPGSSPASPYGSVPAVNPSGLPVGSARGGLGSGILQQQRAIRMRGAAAAAVNQMQQQQQQQQAQQQARHRQQQQHQWDDSSEEDEEGDGRGRMGRYGAVAGAHRMTVGGAAVRKQLQRWSPEAQLSGKKWERAFAGWESETDEDEEFIIRQGFKH
ncbi:unnamed protein product [Closterium sp. NIES-53]